MLDKNKALTEKQFQALLRVAVAANDWRHCNVEDTQECHNHLANLANLCEDLINVFPDFEKKLHGTIYRPKIQPAWSDLSIIQLKELRKEYLADYKKYGNVSDRDSSRYLLALIKSKGIE